MKRILIGVVAAFIVAANPAFAHVTVQPNEAVIGSFSRFVVRVPNEQEEASTTKVQVNLPPLAFTSFEPKDGWQRQTETVEFDEPIVAFEQEITEGIGTVTWSGGEIKPHEFVEFGFSARMPDEETTLSFEAIQTYDNGDVVRWVGAADSEEPAAQLNVLDIGADEGQGQLGVLAEVAGGDDQAAAGDDGADDEEDEDSNLGTILGGLGVMLGAAALIVTLTKKSTNAA